MAEGVRHGAGKGEDAETGVSYEGEYAFDRPVAIPSRMEVAPAPSPPSEEDAAAAAATEETTAKEEEEEEEEQGPPVGTADAPVAVTAGQGLPSGLVRVRVRLPWVPPPPPPPPAEGEEEAAAAAAEDSDNAGLKIGKIATHESGRALRCTLHVGVPIQPEPEEAAAPEDGAEAVEPALPPLVYGEVRSSTCHSRIRSTLRGCPRVTRAFARLDRRRLTEVLYIHLVVYTGQTSLLREA